MSNNTTDVTGMTDTSPSPTVLAVHDLSCYGRCALTVVVPTLSAMGYQVVPLPTALLSTHTGGYEGFTFLDLEDEMKKITEHWKTLSLRFDAFYSGFLGSASQCRLISSMIDDFSPGAVLVDPVLGDDGELYRTITQEHVSSMRDLCRKAEIITPNLTEAFFLTDHGDLAPTAARSSDGKFDADMISTLCEELLALGPEGVVITGIPTTEDGEGRMTTAVCSKGGGFELFSQRLLDCRFPGTGDLFASVLLGKIMSGENVESAARAASEFVWISMESSSRRGSTITDNRAGVDFEKRLGDLIGG